MTYLDDFDRSVAAADDGEYDAPEDVAGADRLLSVLRAIERDEAEINAVYEARLADLDSWREDRMHGVTRAKGRITHLLEGWARAMHKDTERKTWQLPSGTLTLRGRQPKLAFRDDEEAVAINLAGRFGEHVRRVTYAVNKNVVKNLLKAGPRADEPPEDGYVPHLAVTDDGEYIPGVRVMVPEQDKFRAAPRESGTS